jgi:two-component system, cell cycle sensor histidine kinase and response regulator CckA
MSPVDDRVLRAVLDRSSDLVTLADAASVPFYVSPSSLAILGRTPDEILASGMRTYLDPDETDRLRAIYIELLGTPNRAESFRYRIRHSDGTWRVLDAVAQNFLESREIGAIVVQARDITADAAREEAIRQSERRFRALTEFGGDGISVVGLDGTIRYRNAGGARVTGYDEVGPQMSYARVHPDDVARLSAAWSRAVASVGHVERLEYRVRHKRGHYVTLSVILGNHQDDPAINGIVFNFRDVSDLVAARREAEARAQREAMVAELGILAVSTPSIEALDESVVQRLLGALEVDAVEIVEEGPDRSLRVVATNGLPSVSYGAGLDSPQGFALMCDALVLVEDLRTETRCRVPASLLETGMTRCACAVIHGVPRPVGAIVAHRRGGEPFTTDDGHILQAVANLLGAKRREMKARAELALAEEQLRRGQRLESIGQLAAGIAHDFNNLLVGIIGYASMLAETFEDDPAASTDLSEILAAGQRAADLTRQILAFSRQQVLKRESIDLNSLVEGMLKLLRRVTREDVTIDWIPGHDLGMVNADPGSLEQVLVNLAVNASDAMPNGGRLTIETAGVVVNGEYVRAHPEARAGRYVLLTVSDTGSGVPSGVLGRMFEPFFTTKALGRGTGLGLATVHGIVNQHGRMINVYSDRSWSGRGTGSWSPRTGPTRSRCGRANARRSTWSSSTW